jgi:hypothetical protein
MKRSFSIIAALAVSLVSGTGTAVASPKVVDVFHFKGRAASAVLTDCEFGSPIGTECHAIDVFAFEQRVNDNGDRFGGPGFSVTLFDIVITDVAPFYAATPIGSGFTDAASVSLSANLTSGSASAVDVPLCDMFPCAPGALETISVSVQWVGYGSSSKFRGHDTFDDGLCSGNFHSSGTSRLAHATGTVDGESFVEPVVIEFPATLQTDKSGSLIRCANP